MALLDSLSKYLFIGSAATAVVGGAFAYGVIAHKKMLPPVPLMMSAKAMIDEVLHPSDDILHTAERFSIPPIEQRLPDALEPGLLLVAGITDGRDTSVKVIDRAGNVYQQWLIRWSDVWPDGTGEFAGRRPETGMYLHGVDLLPDGDLVANFEHLSTFRADLCGPIQWKLNNLGHHAVHPSYDGTIWVTAEDYIAKNPTGLPQHEAPLRSWKLQQLAPDGNVLREISVFDILVKNDLMGLMYLSTLENGPYSVTGDTLHLNDVDVFPDNLPSSVFVPGDIMLSLRNINTILVIDPVTLKVKFQSTGQVVRQHDPDFAPGDKITVFDNHNFKPAKGFGKPASRIVEFDVRTGSRTVLLDDKAEQSFYTNVMGTHQRLANGNVLVTESEAGRMLEFTPAGKLAYRYDNRRPDGTNGRMFIAKLLPPAMNAAFFKANRGTCKA